jgi:transposase
MINTLKKIYRSIQTVEEYLERKKENGDKTDRRIENIYRATMNGEEKWFLEMIKTKDSSCIVQAITECPDVDSKKEKKK